jgi:nucleotidyltransferase substrate binding protein (TIGR01987 family)
MNSSIQNDKSKPLQIDIKKYRFFNILVKLSFIDQIWLYGSRARKDNSERSDIDLAIVCPKANDSNWLQVREILENADTLLKIDCIRFDLLSENNPLRQAIIKQGECLFMRQEEENQNQQKITDSFLKLEKALAKLIIALNKPMEEDRTNIDASIQRFEFTIELFWKLLKRLIENLGGEVSFPKEVLKEAYKANMISDEQIWLLMLEDRNQTSHTYDEELADKIYKNLHIYYPIMQQTYDRLKKTFKPEENENHMS